MEELFERFFVTVRHIGKAVGDFIVEIKAEHATHVLTGEWHTRRFGGGVQAA